MASRFPLFTTVITISLFTIKNCIPVPMKGACGAGHVVIIDDAGSIIRCHECYNCGEGRGLTIPCHGQNVTVNTHIACVPCVSGSNYSTGHHMQCQPCLKKVCKSGEYVDGICGPIKDARKCKGCPNHSYYNKTVKSCLPCSCENMTQQIMDICSDIGYNVTLCENAIPRKRKKSKNLPDYSIIIIIVGSVLIVVVAVIFVCFYKSKLQNLLESWCYSRRMCSENTAPSETLNYSQASVVEIIEEVTEEDNRKNNEPCGDENDLKEKCLHRQHSCPVTKNEKSTVLETEKIRLLDQKDEVTECLQRKLKFLDMNTATCSLICKKMMDNNDVGMGYSTLAGKMNFSHSDMKDFKRTSNTCEEIISCWSNKDEKHNVIELLKMIEDLKRADVADLLRQELIKKKNECGCEKCIDFMTMKKNEGQ